ncbi:MAG: hypothetical protein L0Y72_19765 [Gemmataceae bacterium]|nr:hypothetical protein [Gemmataceae bacterium]
MTRDDDGNAIESVGPAHCPLRPGRSDCLGDLFGNLTEDRVQFSTGRDINLEPRQKGPALNFFIYPYAEVDGQPYALDKVDRTFAYVDQR